MLRVTLSISTLVAALLVAGAGSGVAAADPDDPAGTGSTSEPGDVGDPPAVGEPTPAVEPQPTTATPPSIFDIPRNIATQLRDMMGRPLSIFGNGRVPGTHTLPDTSAIGDATPGRKGDKVPVKQPEPTVPKPPVVPDPVQQAPVRKPSNSSIDVTLPFSAPKISVPVPDLQVPGYESMRWTLDLSDPYAAYTSVGQTLRTVNALLTDAYAPYNPFKPPPPKPSARIMEDGPVVDAGGTVDAIPLAGGSNLPVVQAPVLIPPIRLAPVRPMTGSLPDVSLPAASAPQALGTGRPAVRAPAPRDAAAQPGSAPPANAPPKAEPSPPSPSSPSSSPMGNPVLREGYPQYLRSSRITQVASVALPGLAGLIALTASGGMIGYRQANSGRYLRSGAERFLQ